MQKRLNRVRCHLAGTDSCGPKEPCISWGGGPQWEGTILRDCPANGKALVVPAAMYAVKGIIQLSVMVCCSASSDVVSVLFSLDSISIGFFYKEFDVDSI